MHRLVILSGLLVCAIASAAPTTRPAVGPLAADVPVRGWTLLSSSEADDMAVLQAAPAYGINHIQLSHQIIGELNDLKDEKKRGLVNRLIDAAHAQGVSEVVAWDHALYNLEYYPEQFRTAEDGTIDLDNPAFWDWLKADYRAMLDPVPKLDGVILTFTETGARAERQHSEKLKSNQAKIAAVVNAV